MKEEKLTKDDQTEQSSKPRRRRSKRRSRSSSQSSANQASNVANQGAKENAGSSNQKRNHNRRANQKSRTRSYNKPRREQHAEKKVTQKEVVELLLPSATALHEFEYAVEGGAERLLNIAKAEQEHRHEWENYALKSQIKSQRLGLLFGAFIAAVALFLVKGFAEAGQEELAKITAISVFGTFALAILFAFVKGVKKSK